MVSPEVAAEGRTHLRVLARSPRPAGGPGEARARAYCAEVLRAAGFRTREELFEYSSFPGRYATTLGGIAAVLALGAAALAGREGMAWAPLATLALALAAIGGGGWWMARWGVADLPVMRERGVNLTAIRGVGEPDVWLVAHLDSKSQPVPILARAAGITLLALVWLTALGTAIAAWRGAAVGGWWPWLLAAGVAAGAPVILSLVGERSPGAADNASGVAAVLEAAAMLDPSLPVGVLLTSGEELGLAGARLWVRGRRVGVAVNCDTVDDRGSMTVMFTGRRPARLLEATREAAATADTRIRAHRLLPGILTDGVAFADAGWEAITLSRGTAATLRRVHTPGDSLDRMRGEGIAAAARLLAGIAGRMAA